jgi:hypothetical protein
MVLFPLECTFKISVGREVRSKLLNRSPRDMSLGQVPLRGQKLILTTQLPVSMSHLEWLDLHANSLGYTGDIVNTTDYLTMFGQKAG